MFMRRAVVLAGFLLLSCSVAGAAERIGVVLMHGKGGTALPLSPIGGLASYLRANGILVVTPDMPWSRDRRLDRSYDESMSEIDAAVKRLKDEGATKVVVGGHSMGGNAALGYGARRNGLAGVMVIAPGQAPELAGFQDKIESDWRRAKAMVDGGHGDDSAEFHDVNQGEVTTGYYKARIYLSWFAPSGPAVMPENAAQLKSGTALLWVVGDKDPMFRRGKAYAFDRAPPNPKNEYIVVPGGHKATPNEAKVEILKWLRSL